MTREKQVRVNWNIIVGYYKCADDECLTHFGEYALKQKYFALVSEYNKYTKKVENKIVPLDVDDMIHHIAGNGSMSQLYNTADHCELWKMKYQPECVIKENLVERISFSVRLDEVLEEAI